MKKLKLQGEREGPPTYKKNTRMRVKKTRVGLTDLKARKTSGEKRLRSTANTKPRKQKSLAVAVKAEKRVDGPKAKRRTASIKGTTEEVGQGAKTKMFIRKRRGQNKVRVKIDIRVMNPIKRILKNRKGKLRREQLKLLGSRRSLEAKSDHQRRMSAGTGIEKKRIKKKNEKKTEAEEEAGVKKGDTTATGRAGEEEHPGIKIGDREVETGARLGTRTEAGALETEVTGEIAARTGPPIEKIRAETLPTKGDVDEAAAALRATELEEGSDRSPESSRRNKSPSKSRDRRSPARPDSTKGKTRNTSKKNHSSSSSSSDSD